MRKRIAADLHDDLGASLTRIAILSEVAARRAGETGDVHARLLEIAGSAREAVDAASDIVWSTDPDRDELEALIARLHRFAADVLEGAGITCQFEAETARIHLDPEQRRNLFLVLKEAVHNAARHSGAKNVRIRVAPEGETLHAEVHDDGHGFALAEPGNGNGLASMRARATHAGGSLRIESQAGAGTRIELQVPLRR
jgi:signal transduction histidine kinase